MTLQKSSINFSKKKVSSDSRNMEMSEELLRKMSSQFRKDMRKLNIMKEVNSLIEN